MWAFVVFDCPRKVLPCIGRTGCGMCPQTQPQTCWLWHQTKCCALASSLCPNGRVACFRKHRISNLAQCVDFTDDSVKHYGNMPVGFEALYLERLIMLAAEVENYSLLSIFISRPYIGSPLKCVPSFMAT